MSAYVCHHDTIDLVASASQLAGTSLCYLGGCTDLADLWRDGTVPDQTDRISGITGAATLARILYRENVRSVNSKYRESTPSDGYRFKAVIVSGRMAPTIFKSIACLRYQSCESDDYATTAGSRVLDWLESAVIQAMPGYNDAPWGWKRGEPLPTDRASYQAPGDELMIRAVRESVLSHGPDRVSDVLRAIINAHASS